MDDKKGIYGLTFNEKEESLIKGISFGEIETTHYDYEAELLNLERRLNIPGLYFTHPRVGQYFINKRGSQVEIKHYVNMDEVYAEVTTDMPNGDIKKYLKKISTDSFIYKRVRSPYDRGIYNMGYMGVGEFNKANQRLFYEFHHNMFMRIYSDHFRFKNPTYQEVSIDYRFFDFQYFCQWAIDNYYSFNDGESMTLDKDLLFKNNKIYSPETCMFLPKSINSAFSRTDKYRGDLPIGVTNPDPGVYQSTYTKECKAIYLGRYPTPEEAFYKYKEAREKEIKRIADVYMYEKGGINTPQFHKIYQAMYNYQVEITD